MIQPISFRGVYKYPEHAFSDSQEKFYQKFAEVIKSPKYADKKGRTLEQAFDSYGFNLVMVPNDNEHVGIEIINKQEPISYALTKRDRRLMEHNYQNSHTAGTEENLVNDLNSRLNLIKRKLRVAYITIGTVFAISVPTFLFLLGSTLMNKKGTETAINKIETVIQKNDTIKNIPRDTLNIFK